MKKVNVYFKTNGQIKKGHKESLILTMVDSNNGLIENLKLRKKIKKPIKEVMASNEIKNYNNPILDDELEGTKNIENIIRIVGRSKLITTGSISTDWTKVSKLDENSEIDLNTKLFIKQLNIISRGRINSSEINLRIYWDAPNIDVFTKAEVIKNVISKKLNSDNITKIKFVNNKLFLRFTFKIYYKIIVSLIGNINYNQSLKSQDDIEKLLESTMEFSKFI